MMKEKIIQMIGKESPRNPLTDEEVARALGIFRETVTIIRKEAGIPDSRERRKKKVLADIQRILEEAPQISDRKLTKLLTEEGYAIGKYAVGKLREELLAEWTPPVKTALWEQGTDQLKRVNEEQNEIFRSFVGYNGSMKNQIQRAKAAILYPPKGLHCMLYGPSGVGKSYLAELMYEYAITTDNFDDHAPFFAFNCADYADNPQLLLAQLFGYNKGAFTGATEHKKGIVEQCDGGILFLDEVHRLPPEGQEILFYLMDKGKFRRLGEVDTQRESRLMIIAATTENPQNSLLLTFRRRIPMIIEIPPLKERPLKEKIKFIRRFFWMESSRLGQKMLVKAEVIWYLVACESQGNIGQLKSDIQVCCAKAFLESKTRRQKQIVVSFESLSEGLKKEKLAGKAKSEIQDLVPDDMVFEPDTPAQEEPDFAQKWDIYETLEKKYNQLRKDGLREKEIEQRLYEEIEESLLRHIRQVEDAGIDMEEISSIVGFQVLEMAKDIYQLAKKEIPYLEKEIVFPLAIHLKAACERVRNQERVVEAEMKNLLDGITEEWEIAQRILRQIEEKYYVHFCKEEAGFLAMYLHKFRRNQNSEEKISVLVVSHGAVACGMAEVANAVMGVQHAVGLELNLKDTPIQMADKVIQTVRQIDKGAGCLILADMGSLLNVGERVKTETGIAVRVVGRVDTLMVIEAIRKTFWTEESLDQIAEQLDVKGVAVGKESELVSIREKAILCLCITGKGAAESLKQFMEERLKSSLKQVKIVTRGYIESADTAKLIQDMERSYEILAIVGTIDPGIANYPFLSIREIYEADGLRKLRKLIKRRQVLDNNQLKEVICLNQVFCHDQLVSKEQVLDQMVEYLVEEHFVEPEFLLSVYKREGSMPTFLNGGIAIPHGSTTLITKPAICITKLDNPVIWDGINTVDLIFLLALDENSKKYFEQLYQLISDEWLVSALRKASCREEVYQILCKNTKSVK